MSFVIVGIDMEVPRSTSKNIKTGPNDASGVVWAISECFVSCFIDNK